MDDNPSFTSLPISSAYAQFLEKLSDEEFWRLAGESAYPLCFATTSSEEYLLCTLRHGYCLLPITAIREVVSPPYHFTLFPDVPPWMPGVSIWRGEIIAVIDLDAYLLNSTTGITTSLSNGMNGILLAIQRDRLTLGIFVSSVEAVTGPEEEPVIPFVQGTHHCKYTRTNAIKEILRTREEQEGEVLMLDVSALLDDIVQQIAG